LHRSRMHTVTMTPRLVLAIGLALTSVVLAVAVLAAILGDHGELSEVSGRVLTVCIAAMAGAMGVEIGRLLGRDEKKR
jgi:hypothetical protein